MRYRLSSFLLTLTLVSVLLAWYVDHHRYRADDIVGVWYYPTLDHPFHKGKETLTLRADGTFTLQQWIATYSGTYTLAGNGIALFHVTSKQQLFGGAPPETYDVDETYRCRIARDSYSNLIVVELDPDVDSLNSDLSPLGDVKVVLPEDVDIAWHCYTSMSHDAQSEAIWKELISSMQNRKQVRESD
ncbi:MAG: hypothetical protein ACYC4U_30720 [Pirellulaceae bacterium]